MFGYFSQFKDYLNLLWLRRWIVVVCAWVVCLVLLCSNLEGQDDPRFGIEMPAEVAIGRNVDEFSLVVYRLN